MNRSGRDGVVRWCGHGNIEAWPVAGHSWPDASTAWSDRRRRWYGPAVAHDSVARSAEHLETVKGSRFLAQVAPVDDEAGVSTFLARSRGTHRDASHHCLAWRIGDRYGSDDDGEPGGTAGRPMLDVILKRDLDRVAVVCVRWFGGTKLGAGGLMRAYGGSAAKALDAAGVRFVADTVAVRVRIPYPHLDAGHRLLDGWPHLDKGEATFDEDAADVQVVLRADDVDELRRQLADASRGDVTVDSE